jgi:hypothetical protein
MMECGILLLSRQFGQEQAICLLKTRRLQTIPNFLPGRYFDPGTSILTTYVTGGLGDFFKVPTTEQTRLSMQQNLSLQSLGTRSDNTNWNQTDLTNTVCETYHSLHSR